MTKLEQIENCIELQFSIQEAAKVLDMEEWEIEHELQKAGKEDYDTLLKKRKAALKWDGKNQLYISAFKGGNLKLLSEILSGLDVPYTKTRGIRVVVKSLVVEIRKLSRFEQKDIYDYTTSRLEYYLAIEQAGNTARGSVPIKMVKFSSESERDFYKQTLEELVELQNKKDNEY